MLVSLLVPIVITDHLLPLWVDVFDEFTTFNTRAIGRSIYYLSGRMLGNRDPFTFYFVDTLHDRFLKYKYIHMGKKYNCDMARDVEEKSKDIRYYIMISKMEL